MADTETSSRGKAGEAPTPAPDSIKRATPGRIVTAYAAPKDDATGKHDGGFDGDLEAVALVTKVYEDGSVNLRVFAPNGGVDTFVTGARNLRELAPNEIQKAPMWDWPART